MKAERGAVRAGLLGLLLAAMCRCSGGWLMIDDAGSTEAGFRFDDGSQHGDLGPSVDACAMQCGGVRVEPIAGTCTYPIPCELGGGGDDRGNTVHVGDMGLPQAPAAPNSWSYTDADKTAIRIDGPLCTEIMNGAIVDVWLG